MLAFFPYFVLACVIIFRSCQIGHYSYSVFKGFVSSVVTWLLTLSSFGTEILFEEKEKHL